MNIVELKTEIDGIGKHLLSLMKVKDVIEIDDNVILQVSIENSLTKDLIEKNLRNKLNEICLAKYNKPLKVEYYIETTQQNFFEYVEVVENIENVENRPIKETVDLDKVETQSVFKFKNKYELNQKYTFDSLLHTDENSFAVKAIENLVDGHLQMPIVLITGPSGVGKTHLLHAAGWAFAKSRNHMRIKVISGDEFINDFQTALFTKTTGAYRDKYRLKTDLLLIDDIQAIAKAKLTQQELFNLMNDFSLSGKKIIFSCDTDLKQIQTLDERLLSRFDSALKLDLERPSFQSKSNYFQHLLMLNKIELVDELKTQLSGHFGSCYRSVEGIINRLLMLRKINGCFDVEVLNKMFPVMTEKQKINMNIDQAFSDVSIRHKIKISDIKGKSRKKEIFMARKEVIHILKEQVGLTVADIARLLDRDHTSILNALN